MNNKPPARIWLQHDAEPPDDEDDPIYWDDTTWCSDKIHDTDVQYIRMDLHKAALARAKRTAS